MEFARVYILLNFDVCLNNTLKPVETLIDVKLNQLLILKLILVLFLDLNFLMCFDFVVQTPLECVRQGWRC